MVKIRTYSYSFIPATIALSYLCLSMEVETAEVETAEVETAEVETAGVETAGGAPVQPKKKKILRMIEKIFFIIQI